MIDSAKAPLVTEVETSVKNDERETVGRKTRVAIYGGAFDPVTSAHIATAKFVLNSSKAFDEVWLMPCYGHMSGKQMAPAQDRLEMCRQSARVDGRLKVSDYEIANKLAGETFRLAKSLAEDTALNDDHDFSFIIGSDNANTFSSWVNAEELKKMAKFVVVSRTGINLDPAVNWYRRPPHIFMQNETPLLLSSTMVRGWLKDCGANFRALESGIDPLVLNYIQKQGLYGVK